MHIYVIYIYRNVVYIKICYIHIYVHSPTGHLDCFLLGYCKEYCKEHRGAILLQDSDFVSLRYIPISGITVETQV